MLLYNQSKIDPSEYGVKLAGIRLQSPIPQWSDEILQTLINTHDYIPMEKVVVNFLRRDENTGTAFAFITIQGSPNILIPVIIKDWEMSPLDIMLIKDNSINTAGEDTNLTDYTFKPLDEKSFGSAVDLDPVGTPQPNVSYRSLGWSEDGSAMRLPTRGRMSIASVVNVDPAKQAELRRLLSTVKTALVGFAKNETLPALKLWLNTETAPAVKTAMLKETKTATVNILSKAPEAVKVSDARPGFTPVVMQDGSIKPVSVMKMADLDGTTVKTALFHADGSYTYTDANTQLQTVDICLPETKTATVNETPVKVGDIVCVPLADGIISTPFKVASITDDTKVSRSYLIKVSGELNGKQVNLRLTPAVKEAIYGAKEYVLPLSTRLTKLHGYNTQSKTAAASEVYKMYERAVPDFVHTNGALCNLKLGSVVNESNIEKTAASILLKQWFGSDSLLEEAQKLGGIIRFKSNIDAVKQERDNSTTLFNKVASKAASVAQYALSLEKAVKLATWMPDEDSVDAILSLGMMSPDNISEFLSCKETFRDCVESLAKLLFYTRIGLGGDETATTVAMKSLQRVADKLDSVSQEVVI